MHFDVYNGDADGICSLLQLRLENPLTTERVTGVKRDIALLERVQASAGDHVTVLDISMVKNNAALQRLLQQGASVDYIDHAPVTYRCTRISMQPSARRRRYAPHCW